MTLANTTTSNTCGGTLQDNAGGALNAGDPGIKLINGVVAANGSCTITVNVTAPAVGTYPNTTNNLFIGTTDTGNSASASLVVGATATLPRPPASCANPVQLATWDMASGTDTNGYPNYASKAGDVSTATASYTTVSGAQSINATIGNTTYGWGGTAPTGGGGWAETASSMANYFQFVLDTHNYNGVYVTFDGNPSNPGDWANPNSNVFVNTSTDGVAFTVYTPTPQSAKNAWTSMYAKAAATGTSNTTFRFGVDGSGNNKPNATYYLDNVTFWGCKRPAPPTVVKSFSPNPVAVGSTSTLNLTISNPNSAAGDLLSGISLSDYLPFENLQGTVTTNGTTAVVGTGTAFKTQLVSGSIVYIPSTLVNLAGTVAVTQGSRTVAGSGTAFSTELAVGSIISIASVNYTVSAIASNTSLTLARPYRASTASGLTASSNTKATYTVSSITDDTRLTLTASAPAASNVTMGAGLTLTATPTTTCSGSTVTGASGQSAIDLSGNSLTGTVQVTNGSATVTGTGTSFTTQLAVGSNVYINSVLYKVSVIGSATSLTLSTTYAGTTASGLTMTTDSTNLTGTVTVTNGSTTVTGSSTTFTTQLAVGNVVTINSGRYTVSAIGSNTSLTLATNYRGASTSGLTMTKAVGLAGGATCTITATVKANAAGVRTNVSGTITSAEGGENTTSTGYATANLTAVLPPVISKQFALNPIVAGTGNVSTLTFIITNPNQNDALSGVQFIDPFPSGVTVASPLATTNTCTAGGTPGTLYSGGGTAPLAAGDGSIRLGSSTNTNTATIAGGGSCTISVNVTAPAAGAYPNASGNVAHIINGSSVNGNTASDTLKVNPVHPSISILKRVSTSASGPWYTSIGVSAGTPIYYQFTVENTGDTALTSVNVTDPTLSGLGVSLAACTWANMPLYDVQTCVVGPVNAASGSHSNTATAHGTYSGAVYDSNPSTATYATTGLTLVKGVTERNFRAAGDVLHYTFLVTNSGFASLLGPVTVADDKATDESCPAVNTVGDRDDWLDAGESITCSATYTVWTTDVQTGYVTNIASATAGGVTSPTDTETVNVILNKALTIVKTATPATYNAVNQVISYGYLVTNSGFETLSGPFTVSDDKATDESCPATASLAPDASITCTASYTITQADLDAGSVTNIASASGGGATSPTDTETVTATQSPALTIVKSATPTTYSTVGTTINYSYLVVNTGNVTLSAPFTVSDDKTTNEACPATPTSLSPNTGTLAAPSAGSFIICTSSYTISQTDLNNGSVTNVASAQGFAGTTPVTSPTDTETVTATQSPALTIVKSATPTTYSTVGATINYSYLVVNTGNVTLSAPFTVSDDKTTNEACPATPTSLSPNTGTLAAPSAGSFIICTSSYTISQTDLNNGSGDQRRFRPGVRRHDARDLANRHRDRDRDQSPALTIVKSATPTTYSTVGATINYSYLVVNTGNVTLSAPFTVSDDKTTNEACPATPASLSPNTGTLAAPSAGSFIICTSSYTISQTDLNNGSVTNVASAQGFAGTTPVTSPTDTETVTAAMDYGDLPDTTDGTGSGEYQTLLANNGPRHLLTSNLYLGACVDSETNGQPNGAATGDNNNLLGTPVQTYGSCGLDGDEDGVARNMSDTWAPGNSVRLNVTVFGVGEMACWIDWNGSGNLGDSLDEFINIGNVSQADNVKVVSVTIPNDQSYKIGDPLYVRCRLFPIEQAPGGFLDQADYLGFAPGGEVEDYRWTFGPNAVTLRNLQATTISNAERLMVLLKSWLQR